MDGSTFDALTRSLGTAGSRRRALAGLLGGALGLRGWREGKDIQAHDLSKKCKKKSGKQKKKCLKKAKQHSASHGSPCTSPGGICENNACKMCQERTCVNNDGYGCENNACKVCQGGACVNNNGIGCEFNPCKVCQGGRCVNVVDNTPCNNTGKCLSGSCNPPPMCSATGAPCAGGQFGHCCSQGCTSTNPGTLGSCVKSDGGERCRSDADCATGLSCNASFVCQGACSAGADACSTGPGTAPCGTGGQCFQPVGDGPSQCGESAGTCGCTSHQQCATNHVPGAFCVQITGTHCTGCAAGTFCAAPR
jgi:hypothetical protein